MKQVFERLRLGGRVALYVAGFTLSLALDPETPLGAADWLLGLTLVWVAATWGGAREMVAVCGVAVAGIAIGLWTSAAGVPLWEDALNRLVAIAIAWMMVHVARARRVAEAERRRATEEVRVLQGLLPICAGCKAIRGGAGDWHALELYITEHSEAIFSHTYCPSCTEKYFSGLNEAGESPATRAGCA